MYHYIHSQNIRLYSKHYLNDNRIFIHIITFINANNPMKYMYKKQYSSFFFFLFLIKQNKSNKKKTITNFYVKISYANSFLLHIYPWIIHITIIYIALPTFYPSSSSSPSSSLPISSLRSRLPFDCKDSATTPPNLSAPVHVLAT